MGMRSTWTQCFVCPPFFFQRVLIGILVGQEPEVLWKSHTQRERNSLELEGGRERAVAVNGGGRSYRCGRETAIDEGLGVWAPAKQVHMELGLHLCPGGANSIPNPSPALVVHGLLPLHPGLSTEII